MFTGQQWKIIRKTEADTEIQVTSRQNPTCTLCKIGFNSRSSFLAHYKKKHANLPRPPPETELRFSCDKCPNIYTNIDTLKKHNQATHLAKPPAVTYSCKSCNISFRSRQEDRDHKHQYHLKDMYPYPCKSCKRRFITSTDLLYHLKNIHNIIIAKSTQCEICLKKFNSVGLKRNHCKDKHPDTIFSCRICTNEFRSRKKRVRHELEVHEANVDNPENVFKCNKCNKLFGKKFFFTSHVEKHCK